LNQPTHPDEAELSPGFAHDNLEGQVLQTASEDELRTGLEKAFDYRGDVTIMRKDGSTVEGYVFDRRTAATLNDSVVRLLSKDGPEKIAITYSDIAGLAFTGRDPAAGKSWSAWVTKYWEKKAAGEKQIEITPEKLD
jgi:hypothetical protein